MSLSLASVAPMAFAGPALPAVQAQRPANAVRRHATGLVGRVAIRLGQSVDIETRAAAVGCDRAAVWHTETCTL